MKDQLSGQLKMSIVSYTAGHITLIYYSQVFFKFFIEKLRLFAHVVGSRLTRG